MQLMWSLMMAGVRNMLDL